jgi:hypothetical protein
MILVTRKSFTIQKTAKKKPVQAGSDCIITQSYYFFVPITAGIGVALVLPSRMRSEGGGVGLSRFCCCFAMLNGFNISFFNRKRFVVLVFIELFLIHWLQK